MEENEEKEIEMRDGIGGRGDKERGRGREILLSFFSLFFLVWVCVCKVV